MTNDLPLIIAGLDNAEEVIRELAKILMAGVGEFTTTWECVNRVCDRYDLPQPV
jgi:hypothetical protein